MQHVAIDLARRGLAWNSLPKALLKREKARLRGLFPPAETASCLTGAAGKDEAVRLRYCALLVVFGFEAIRISPSCRLWPGI